jgi:hypothetical protein
MLQIKGIDIGNNLLFKFFAPSKSRHVIYNQSIVTQAHIGFPRQILAS